jgi:hypothetical protein
VTLCVCFTTVPAPRLTASDGRKDQEGIGRGLSEIIIPTLAWND